MIRSFKGITPTIPTSCYVDPSAQVVGDVVLGEHASIWMNAVVRGDVHEIRIGAHSNVQDCSVLHGMKEKYGVYLGEYVTVGGLLFERFGHIPNEGEQVRLGDWDLRVVEMDKRRVAQVLATSLTRPVDPTAPEEGPQTGG